VWRHRSDEHDRPGGVDRIERLYRAVRRANGPSCRVCRAIHRAHHCPNIGEWWQCDPGGRQCRYAFRRREW
jgi:hypothetical protein